MFKNVLCPIDGSVHANKALGLAVNLAKTYDARFPLIHVLLRNADAAELNRFAEIEGLTKTVSGEVNRLTAADSRVEAIRLQKVETIPTGLLVDIGEYLLEAARIEAEDKGISHVKVEKLDGDPAKRILEYAEQQSVDCIVMGSRGLSDVKSLVLGSVSHKVSNQARCTCIAVK